MAAAMDDTAIHRNPPRSRRRGRGPGCIPFPSSGKRLRGGLGRSVTQKDPGLPLERDRKHGASMHTSKVHAHELFHILVDRLVVPEKLEAQYDRHQCEVKVFLATLRPLVACLISRAGQFP